MATSLMVANEDLTVIALSLSRQTVSSMRTRVRLSVLAVMLYDCYLSASMAHQRIQGYYTQRCRDRKLAWVLG